MKCRLLLKQKRPDIGFFRNTPFYTDVGGDSILRVEHKAVPCKQLGKTLINMGSMGLGKSAVERILLTSVNQMPHAMDEVNVCTYLSLMVKLDVQNTQCLESIIPFCYRISDLPRAIACCHMISLVKGSKGMNTAKSFAMYVAQRIPLEGHGLSLRDLGRLCEALSTLELYCREFGELLISVIEEEMGTCGSVDNEVFITSVIMYLGRMGMGRVTLWRLYSTFASNSTVYSTPSSLIKCLEAFSNRQVIHKPLFNMAGDMLTQTMESLHPAQLARIAEVYSRSKFYHESLLAALLANMERIISPLDANSVVKLLKAFTLAYGSRHKQLVSNRKLQDRHRRALYLIFNKCSTNINHLKVEELFTITTAMNMFPTSVPLLLRKTLQRFLVQNQQTPCDVTISHHDPSATTVQKLAEKLLARRREARTNVNSRDALLLSHSAGINTVVSRITDNGPGPP